MSYLDLCVKAVDEGLKLNVSEIEATLIFTRSINAEVERGQIKGCNSVIDKGIGIRAIINGQIGFAYTNTLNEESVLRAVKEAIKAAKANLKDEKWTSLPEPRKYPSIEKVYDEKIVSLPAEKTVELSQETIIAAVEYSRNVIPAFGGTSINIMHHATVNSQGIEVEDKATLIQCYLATIARKGNIVSPICYEFSASRMYEVDPKEIGRKVAELAVKATEIGKAEEGKFTVVFDPIALSSILTFTFGQAIKGDMVQRGRSPYQNKIGTQVASPNISFYDNGILPGGLFSSICDLEGVPRQNTPIIVDGVLKGFIYDNYWAKIVGVESTGNAWRGGAGLMLPPYATLPYIELSNVVLQAKNIVEREIIREVKNGYYVRDVQGAHQSNPETGEFSVAAVPCWRIIDGEIKYAVKGVMLAGNIYELMNKIVLVGDKPRQVNNFILPKVAISDVQVVL